MDTKNVQLLNGRSRAHNLVDVNALKSQQYVGRL